MRSTPSPAKYGMNPEQFEIERLCLEVTKLKAEREIPEKAAAHFAKEFSFIAKHPGIWATRVSRKVIRKVLRSGATEFNYERSNLRRGSARGRLTSIGSCRGMKRSRRANA